jgi:putative ABC transport system ATP-binding protein
MLSLKNIHVYFGKHHIIKDISCSVEEGDFIVIVGGNGAGKSTFFDTIAGKVRPTTGNIFFQGNDITDTDQIYRSRMIARLFQNTALNSVGILTVAQNFALSGYAKRNVGLKDGMSNMNREKLISLLEELHIDPRLLDVQMNQLSGGQRQLLSFMMATFLHPQILLLDEPTAALDPQAATTLLTYAASYIKQNKVTTMLITHDPEIALSIGTKIWILEQGKITKQFSQEEKKNLCPAELIGQIDYQALRNI